MKGKFTFALCFLISSPLLAGFSYPWQQTRQVLPWWVWVIIILLLAFLLWWWLSRAPSEKTAEPVKATTAAPPSPPAAPEPDDLTRIEGIGPKISGILQEAGITTFTALATTGVSRLETIISDAGLRLANPATWPEQATLAAAGKWEDLEALQGRLKGGREV